MKDNFPLKPEISKSQIYYGKVSHWFVIVSCLISLAAQVFILMFPHRNFLNPVLVFNAVFEGKKPAEIWEAAGVPFKSGDFWKLFFKNLSAPDGFAALGIALGCSVTLWAMIPAVWNFYKKKEYFYALVSLFIMALVSFAMSGLG